MYLSFEQKRSIFNSFPLTEIPISYERFNYHFEGSNRSKKVVITQLSRKTGNGYVYGGYLQNSTYKLDSRGWIKVKDFDESTLRELVKKAIQSFI